MLFMFGYVVADQNSLTPDQLERYRSCYCGLCRSIGTQFGTLPRLALNYDVTFLLLLLNALYEPEETAAVGRCAIHPLHPRPFWTSEVTAYCAAVTVALACRKCMDDWSDDRRADRLLLAKLYGRSAAGFASAYPRQDRAIESTMEQLRCYEGQNLQDPDACANAFGDLMGELFVLHQDRWTPVLHSMGQALGRFIFLLDAVCDLEADLKKGRYNPLKEKHLNGWKQTDAEPVLSILMGECVHYFEQLPLVQDVDLMRNILYAGVWTRYHMRKREENHVR